MARRVLGLVVVLAIAWGALALAIAFDLTPKLGLDLQGGTAVILTAEEGTDPASIDVAIDIMNRRIADIGGVAEPDIQRSGADTVVVALPGVEDEERAIEAVGTTGLLSFRPVLDGVPGEIGPLAGTNTPNIDNDTGLTIVDDIRSDSWLITSDQQFPEVLQVGGSELEGSNVDSAQPFFDAQAIGGPEWVVLISFDSEGTELFADMTAQAALNPLGSYQRRIAIVLDGVIISAPQVTPPGGIPGGEASISLGSGEEAQKEATDLAAVLRYGSLPVSFEVSAVNKVSATLGADSLQAGILAGLIGLALVAIVLLIVYRSLGLVAIVGLTVFGSLLIATFGLLGVDRIGVTLTLAIVSIGITTDSYIVYFERLKEKIRQGYPVDEAASEAFRLAFRTILTADTVSLLAAALLWWLAVGAVKGFALALGIATVIDIFVARFYTKRAVSILADSPLGEGGAFSIEGAAK